MNDTAPAKARVLVVDDQPPNVRLLEAILTPRGYDVRTASSGEEALAALDAERRRPRAPRHRDAGHGRLRGVPARSGSGPARRTCRS